MMNFKSVVAMICLLAIAACEDSFVTPPMPDRIVEPESDDQLIPLAVGNRWEYQRSGRDRFVNMTLDSISALFRGYYGEHNGNAGLIDVRGPVYWYTDPTGSGSIPWSYTPTPTGILVGQRPGGSDTVTLISLFVPKYPQPGDSIDFQYNGYGTRWGYFGREDITVPAGTFPLAYGFARLTYGQSHSGIYQDTVWYARGVGMIRSVSYLTRDRPQQITTLESIAELRSYTIR